MFHFISILKLSVLTKHSYNCSIHGIPHLVVTAVMRPGQKKKKKPQNKLDQHKAVSCNRGSVIAGPAGHGQRGPANLSGCRTECPEHFC